MTISLSRGVGLLRFSKRSASGQAAIEFILFAIVLIMALVFLIMMYFDNGGFRNGRDSADIELTQTGTIEGKYIDSTGYGKSYYVTVRNGSHQADHEVSLAEYNAAQVGADFPIVLTDSDSVKADEAREQADEIKAQAAERERQNNAYWQWFWTHRLLTNMSTSSE